jgi:hypothetical protein
MTSPFEVDQELLQSLITALQTYERELQPWVNQLSAAYNNFDSGFMSPRKPQLEEKRGELASLINQFGNKLNELVTGLQNLQQQAQAVGQVTF